MKLIISLGAASAASFITEYRSMATSPATCRSLYSLSSESTFCMYFDLRIFEMLLSRVCRSIFSASRHAAGLLPALR